MNPLIKQLKKYGNLTSEIETKKKKKIKSLIKQKEVYQSWIKHLQKTINFLRGKFPEVELDYKNKISFWQSLANACH